jgi:predicted TIM-barrel fold metal-dependent hydrolase
VFSSDAPAVAGARYRPAYAAQLSAWRALWPAAGITHGVLIQPSFFGTDNREMLAALAADAAPLRGVAVVNPRVDAATLTRFNALGVRAIRLNLKGVKDYGAFASPPWYGLFERIDELGWHIEVQVDSGRLPEIAAALDGPPVPVVFDHFGNPGRDEASIDATFAALQRLTETHEVWGKLSAPYRLESGEPQALAARWLDVVGPRQLVWGSDWPGTGHEGAHEYQRLRAELDKWLDASLAQAVLWDNAARLYQFS